MTDLERAKAFYTAIGFTINPLFTDHNSACVVVEHDHSYFMIQVHEFFQTSKAMGDPREEQIITPDSMTMALRTAFRPLVAANLPATAYAGRFGPAELLIRVAGRTLDVTRGDGPADLAFAAGPGIRRVISGEPAPDRAIATGMVEVLRGRGDLLGRFASTLHLAA